MLDNKLLDFILTVIQVVAQKLINNAPYCSAKKGTVVSNEGTSVTVTIESDSVNTPGIHFVYGQTLAAGNNVAVIKLNNSPKSSDWLAIRIS